ncbi:MULTISPECIES: maleylpyruvate isomerase family mycothiol-dependent enzyme [unclassified Actinoplanes]|uniref:maleylpyruvate isomerase family mycothiol-dependent enzyme n=1 Tax=unclassified Actinoplanes TaxID=2626549 RepID=UPI0005B9431E|nr:MULTISPECIES: maleylpyruvate isomerase family mycothiol-dependent enzyme [unclassified Actinoplanes]
MLSMIADERRRIAELIESLKPSQLITPSLCAGWTVHEVAAHLCAPWIFGARRIVPAVIRHGFRVHRANADLVRDLALDLTADEIALQLRANAEFDFNPPVVGPFGQLTDLQVHGQDICRPLGLTRDLVPERMLLALDFLISPKARGSFVARGRLDGLRFIATDLDWEGGQGLLTVRGAGEALMLAMTGRPVVLDELHGSGAAALRARLLG